MPGEATRNYRAAFKRPKPQPGSGSGWFEQRRENGRRQLQLVARPMLPRAIMRHRRDRPRMGEPIDEEMDVGALSVRFMIGIRRGGMIVMVVGVMMMGRSRRVTVADRRGGTTVRKGQRQDEQDRKQTDDHHAMASLWPSPFGRSDQILPMPCILSATYSQKESPSLRVIGPIPATCAGRESSGLHHYRIQRADIAEHGPHQAG